MGWEDGECGRGESWRPLAGGIDGAGGAGEKGKG